MKSIYEILKYIDQAGIYPHGRVVSTWPSPVVEIDGRQMSMFCTNNYLNLASHPKVIEASMDAIQKYGTGSGGSRLISGTTDMHVALEAELSNLKNTDDTLIFSSGYLANIGAISAIADPLSGVAREIPREFLKIFNKQTVVFSDELNHASILDACKIAKVDCITYKHADMDDLRKKLLMHKDKRKIIVTDGVFSMDGDLAPLPEIVTLAKDLDAITIVDDAHGTGLLGKNGGGTVEYFNLKGQIDLEIGTLNKVFGGVGGFISGNKEICRLLRITSRPYIFSASMPPGVAGGLAAAVKIIREEPELRVRLFENVDYFQKLLLEYNIPFCPTSTPIIPIIIGDEIKTMELSQQLFNHGFFVPAVRWPAVPKGKARFRVTLMVEHTKDQMEAFVQTLNYLLNKDHVLCMMDQKK
jgi:8-amino-7-oxononanoate synthase